MEQAGWISAGPTLLTAKVQRLFNDVHPVDRGPYSLSEVAKITGISRAALSGLRSGAMANPTKETLELLSKFFNVDPGYFFEDRAVDEIRIPDSCSHNELSTVNDQIPEDVRVFAREIAGVSPASRQVLEAALEYVLSRERLESGNHGQPG